MLIRRLQIIPKFIKIGCLDMFSFGYYCYHKHCDQKQTGKREFILPYILKSILKGNQGKHSIQELGGRNCSMRHGGMLFTDLLLKACSGLLPYITKDHFPSVGIAHSELVLTMSTISQEKWPIVLAFRPI